MSLRGLLIIVVMLAALAALMYMNSGHYIRQKAEILGHSVVCVDGVNYLQFSTGATVKLNKDGSVSTCN
jgi:hypothetical protein